ncbi:MAG TPA: CARDB domain-containing protein [Gaiellaceae bacterium]
MTERDSDIDFDFFDEPETQETTQRRRPPREGGPRGPRRTGGPGRAIGVPTGLTPLLRLTLLVVFAIFVIVVLVLWIQSCQGASKRSEFSSYMSKVDSIARGSVGVGKQLNDALTTPGIKESDLETKLNGLAQQQSQYADQAARIDPPGQLRPEHQHLIEVLQLRSSGISRLSDAFRQTAKSKSATVAARLLADQANLLVASDVNYDFYFRDPTLRELKRQQITGVSVPDSNFLSSPDLATVASLKPVWQRIQGAATGAKPTGLHGTGLVGVRALPTGQQLSTSTETTVTASTELAFEVSVKDTGDAQELRIPVKLTIEATPKPIVKTGTINVINPGETKTVTFHITEQPPFGTPTRIKVEVQPVPAEKTISNNSAEYPVIFSLGG